MHRPYRVRMLAHDHLLHRDHLCLKDQSSMARTGKVSKLFILWYIYIRVPSQINSVPVACACTVLDPSVHALTSCRTSEFTLIIHLTTLKTPSF